MNRRVINIIFFIFLPLFILILVEKYLSGIITAEPKYLFFQTIIHNTLAASPILIVLILMTIFHIGGQYAGPAGLITGLIVSTLCFGATTQVLQVSQEKGFLLSLFVIAVFLPALFLYNTINKANGIQAIAQALGTLITDRGMLLIVTAWAFSSMLEGLAGFGLPVAIVSPMLVGMGVDPITAVTSVAVGHAWSVTFGDMGVVFQTLTALVMVDPLQLAGTVTTMLGIACLFCGLGAANIFKRLDRWPVVIVLAFIMGFVQYFLAVTKLPALAGFLAGLAGVCSGIVINRIWFTDKKVVRDVLKYSLPLRSALISYGSLALMMILINLVQPIHSVLAKTTWRVSFPSVTTLTGFFTPEKINQTYQPLLHPGTTILLIALLSYLLNRMLRLYTKTNLANIAAITLSSALPAIIGIFSMVGLSTLMDHSGMNILLANLLSSIFYNSFSIVSPFIGMLGAFATGSNNNSNVLFASLQEGIAAILKISPGIIVAAQTTGGSLGSMIAPAKIIVGLSTVDKKGQEGEVLRRTIPYGLGIGLAMGIITFIMVRVM